LILAKKRGKEKGQAATEYLVILAVVVIIALIVVGVLGGFPTIGRQSDVKASMAYWASAPIGIKANSLTATGDGTLRLVNNLPTSVTVTDIQMDNANPPTTSVYAGADTTLEPGEEVNFALSYDCGSQGDSYSANVEVEYNDDETSEDGLLFQGDNSLVGTCLG